MDEYFDWHGKRLFRRDPSTGAEERWDDKTGGWVDVNDFITREFDMDPDPRFTSLDEAAAKKAYPGAFVAGAKTVAATEDEAHGDSRFTALSVEDMSRVQGYVMGGSTVDQYIEDNRLDPVGDVADQARLYGDLMKDAKDGLTPDQTLSVPGEFS